MPVSVAFRFPAGRYHATPFGHHVNEGLIEWPPSPWRLLRALLSVGYTSGLWNGTGPPRAGRSLIEKLCADLPHYSLPPAVGAHSRHFMPIGALNRKDKTEKTTLVFDTWARVGDRELSATWPNVTLSDDELPILGVLLNRLNYLGRSESWVEGRVMGEGEALPKANCFPEQSGHRPGRGWEQVSMLSPEQASVYEAWRAARTEEALSDLPLPAGRKPSVVLLRKRARAEEPYPADLLDCLQKDTTWLRSHGWSLPPGSRRVFYWRQSNAIAVGAPRAKPVHQPERRFEATLLSLTNASHNDHALPPITRTLPQAELLHRALVGIAAKRAGVQQHGEAPQELTGRDENRKPLRGPHEHAHIIPLDLDDDGHLDHVLIWASMGLGAEAQAAIRAARRTYTKGGVEPLRLAIAASSESVGMIRLPGMYGIRLEKVLSDNATVWHSTTPFVPPRHLKKRGKNTLEGQILAELQSRGFPRPTAVAASGPTRGRKSVGAGKRRTDAGNSEMSWSRFRHFVLSRRHGPEPPQRCGFAIRLEFDQPVSGPIALGYGSHFGLGLFCSA